MGGNHVKVVNEVGEISSTNPFNVTQLNTFVTDSFDYIAVTYPTATSEVYTYKSGGASGTTVATLTVTYSSPSKENLESVART